MNDHHRMQHLWRSLFSFKQIRSMIIGALLYGFITIPFNTMRVSDVGSVAFRPTVAIPIFFGFVFGPVTGLVTGLLGNLISDVFSFGWFFWNWDIGNGLIGLVAGIGYFSVRTQRGRTQSVIATAVLAVAGSAVGTGFAAMMDYLFKIGLTSSTLALTEFYAAATTYALNGAILTPILVQAYRAFNASRVGKV